MRMGLVVVGWILAGAPLPAWAQPQPLAVFVGVPQVVDGDTVRFDPPREERCRLIGIDAPEMGRAATKGQPLAEEARTALSRFLGIPSRQAVVALVYGVEPFGRLLCWLLTPDGESVNVLMVEAGLAEVFVVGAPDRTPFLGRLRVAQVEAQVARRGVWALEGYESPAAYRRRVRQGVD